ncbi:MAG: aminoacyl-tRNA hydrolase [Candidatus Pacebacteria bacterium]|nr:aminoacyl-tRNA hydrolase [Candidatus Paceibacterota bacterium]
MILIIGLGNKGKVYEKTRHNVSWVVFNYLNGDLDWQPNKYAKSLLATTSFDDKDIVFVKPETFMNKSGEVLDYFKKEYKVSVDDLIIIHDDIDLPLGKIKVSYDRGDGGHNGVKSIMNNLGSASFIRIRIGVSILDENNNLHKPDVLGLFSKEEMKMIKEKISPEVGKIIETIVLKGKEVAMNKFN